jgi:quinol monooxygenase YgiN
MITRIVKLTFQETYITDFLNEFEQVKQKVVNFPGCHEMTLLQHHKEPMVFFTYSIWEDEASLERYRTSETFITLWSSIKPMFSCKAEAWSLNLQFHGKNESVKKQ